MKIALPTRDEMIDNHFGHCEAYTIYTIGTDNEIEKCKKLPSPQGCGCKSNIASVLQQIGVTVMLAGNMGDGALNVLSKCGITVYRGCSGKAFDVVKVFLSGSISDSGKGCSAHEEGHQCAH